MNVADLLQSSPSDEHARRRAAAAAQHKAPPQQPQPPTASLRPPHSSSQQQQPPPGPQSRAYYSGPPPPAPNRPPPQGPSTFDLRDAQRAPPRERERDRERDSILYAPVNEPSPMYTGPAADSGPVPARGRQSQSQHHQHPPPPPQHQHPHPHQHQHHHAPVVPMSVTVERRHHRPSHSHSHTPQPHVVPPVREREREVRHVDAGVGMDVELGHHHHRVSLSPHRITHPHPHPHTHGHGHTHTAHVHHPRASTLVEPPPPSTHAHHSHPHSHSHAHVLPQHQHHQPPPPPPAAPKPVKYLGSYTLPQTPFPYTFSARDTGHSVRLTLIIPRRALPDEAYAPRIWGGCAADLERVREGGGRSGGSAAAAVYTDDSDPIGAAVHAGFAKWSTLSLARERGADLSLELELRGDVVRYVGGVGRAYGGGLEGEEELLGKEGNGSGKRNGYRYEEDEEEDDGRGVVSAGWGNGHDGAGFEIVRAGLVQTGMAHGTRRARTHRLKEYASRRAEMMLTPRTMKRGYPFGEDEEEDAHGPEARARKAAVVQPRALEPEARPTILLGAGSGWDANVYRYDPTHLRHALFPPPPPKRTRKRPRRDSSPFPASSSTSTPRTVILETACERFAVRPVVSEGREGHGQGRWEIVLLGRFGKAAMSLSRTNSDYGGASPLPRSPLNNDAPTPPTQPNSFLTPYTSSSLAPGPTSNGESSSNGSGLPPEYPAHDLTRASFAFAGDELRILGPAEPRSGARAGWALDVRRWWVEPVPSAPAPAPTVASGSGLGVGSGSALVPVEEEAEAEKGQEQDVQMEQPTGEVVDAGVGGLEMPEPVVQQTASVERAPVRGAEGAVVPSAAVAADPVRVEAQVESGGAASGEVEKDIQEEGEPRDVVPPGMLPPPTIDTDSAVEVQSSAQLTEEPAGTGDATTEPTVAPAVPDIQPVLPLTEPAPSADVATPDHPGATMTNAVKDTDAAGLRENRPASPADAARAMGFEPAPASTVSIPAPEPVGESGPTTILAPISSASAPVTVPPTSSAPLSVANVAAAAGGQTSQEDVEDGEIASSSGGDAPPPIGETVSAAAPALAGAMGGDGMDVDA